MGVLLVRKDTPHQTTVPGISELSEVNNIPRVPSVLVASHHLISVINKTIKTSASSCILSQYSLAFENKTVNTSDMARQRKERGSDQKNEENVSSPDLPPSYEETIKNGQAGGFIDPTATAGGLPVKTIVQVVQVQMPELGPSPARLQCPSCHMEITTSTSSKPSMMAWSLSLILCFTMLWPCFCVPFCVDSLLNVKHKCPNCKIVLGKYNETC